jgi:hypothetical protein
MLLLTFVISKTQACLGEVTQYGMFPGVLLGQWSVLVQWLALGVSCALGLGLVVSCAGVGAGCRRWKGMLESVNRAGWQ